MRAAIAKVNELQALYRSNKAHPTCFFQVGHSPIAARLRAPSDERNLGQQKGNSDANSECFQCRKE
eukprot:1145329-Pelagomonas_calceolata.AAC.4